jgi:hypothetical protein
VYFADPAFLRRFYDERSFSRLFPAYGSTSKLTQTRLAELLEVSPRVYNRWENGDVIPHFDTISLDKLAGRKEAGDEPRIRNHELHRLPTRIRRPSSIVLDSLVKRSRVSRVMAEL